MITTHFEATDGGLVLTTAILLYQSDTVHSLNRYAPSAKASPAFASIHAVEQSDGQPTIGAGRPLSRAHLRQWTEALGRSVAPEILPANVLVAHPDMLVWWIPEQVRTAYFALSRPPAGLKALAKKTTTSLPYPAHVLVATRAGLGVYALPVSERPGPDTKLLYSPVLNVFISGQLCWGNIAQPKSLAVATMAQFESAVFDSWSTHPNPGQEATISGKGGLVRLWDDLAARRAKRFPTTRMKPFVARAGNSPMTLGKLIAAGGKPA